MFIHEIPLAYRRYRRDDLPDHQIRKPMNFNERASKVVNSWFLSPEDGTGGLDRAVIDAMLDTLEYAAQIAEACNLKPESEIIAKVIRSKIEEQRASEQT